MTVESRTAVARETRRIFTISVAVGEFYLPKTSDYFMNLVLNIIIIAMFLYFIINEI